MKKYSFNTLDGLILKTIECKETSKGTVFFDELKTGEYSVSRDEFCQGVFDKKEDAQVKFHELLVSLS